MQKGESRNGGNKETKRAKSCEKQTFLNPLTRTRTYAYRRVKNARFSETWRALFSCFLHFEIRTFALSPTICTFCLYVCMYIHIHTNASYGYMRILLDVHILSIQIGPACIAKFTLMTVFL